MWRNTYFITAGLNERASSRSSSTFEPDDCEELGSGMHWIEGGVGWRVPVAVAGWVRGWEAPSPALVVTSLGEVCLLEWVSNCDAVLCNALARTVVPRFQEEKG